MKMRRVRVPVQQHGASIPPGGCQSVHGSTPFILTWNFPRRSCHLGHCQLVFASLLRVELLLPRTANWKSREGRTVYGKSTI